MHDDCRCFPRNKIERSVVCSWCVSLQAVAEMAAKGLDYKKEMAKKKAAAAKAKAAAAAKGQ